MSNGVKKKRAIRAVDLFCGVGGLTHGLVLGGVSVAAGIDCDETCKFPYESNNSAKFFSHDVRTLPGAKIKKLFGDAETTLLAGCAPCQPFSTYSQGGKRRSGEDWALVRRFGQLVREVQPDLVTMENVPALERHEVFQEFLDLLDGYHKRWAVIECANIGIPQTRKRLVLIGSKLGDEQLSLDWPKKTRTVRQTIGRLPPQKAGGRDAKDPLHISARLSDLNLKRIRASVPGGTWRDWKPELRATCHVKKSGDTYPSVYGRMEWDEPAPTMTTQCFGFGNGRFGHPEQDRAITLREAAMLQTFPRNYRFLKPEESAKFNRLGRLIGNAVPVKLGELIGRTFVEHVEACKR